MENWRHQSQRRNSLRYAYQTSKRYFAKYLRVVKQIFYPKYTTQDRYLEYCSSTQSPGYGGLFSIVLHSEEEAKKLYDFLPIKKGPSLGTSFTLACPYTLLAHFTELEWAQSFGVSPWLIRVSVGVEDIDWLLDEFNEALNKV